MRKVARRGNRFPAYHREPERTFGVLRTHDPGKNRNWSKRTKPTQLDQTDELSGFRLAVTVGFEPKEPR